MYFACTPPEPYAATEALLAGYSELVPDWPNLRLYAIVDAAFNSPITHIARREGIAVGAGTRLDALKEHLPFVCSVPASKAAIANFFAKCRGNPMLSFVATPMPGIELADTLKQLAIARTADNTRWPLRFADTRVLPVLLAELRAAHNEPAFLANLPAWWWPGRDGSLEGRFADSGKRPPMQMEEVDDELPMDDPCFARMMDAAQADGVIDRLYQACPDLLQGHHPHEIHARVDAALTLLSQKGFDASSLQLRWAALCLAFPAPPDSTAILQETLARATTIDDLMKLIDEVVDEHLS